MSAWRQISECDTATDVFLHRPGLEAFTGSLHPAGSLYERPFSYTRAQAQYMDFEKKLQELGVTVHRVEKTLEKLAKEELISMAEEALQYRLHGDFASALDSGKGALLGSRYKASVLRRASKTELIDIILLRPAVNIRFEDTNTGVFASSISLQPLMNLVFCRDQQIVTGRGLVLASQGAHQRRAEAEVLQHVWKAQGIPVLGRIVEPGLLEGGDFIPVDEDLALIGVGLRTNMAAVHQMLKEDLFGTRRVAVVYDKYDRSQDRMHLDTFFNILAPQKAVVLDSVLDRPDRMRKIKLYVRQPDGSYKRDREAPKLMFGEFLEQEGFQVVRVTDEQQQAYMINFLNVGRRRVISVHPDLEDVIRAAGIDDVEVHYVPFDAVTAMYGAAHCSTQVFRRPLAVAKL